MQLYYEKIDSGVSWRDGASCYHKASEQMVMDAAAEILKKKTGKYKFEIELGRNK